MRAAAIVERRQALRNAGNGDINRGRFEPRKVYRLFRKWSAGEGVTERGAGVVSLR